MLAVLHASQLVTLSGPARARSGPELTELGIITDGGLLVEDGRISRFGKSAEIATLCQPDTEVIDAHGCVVMPGFVDAHTHFVFAGDRLDDFEARARGESYEQIAQRGGGICSTVAATRAMNEEQLLVQAKKRAGWMLRNGTTTAEAKSGYGLTIEDELKILRVIRRVGAETPLQTIGTFLGAHAIPEEFSHDSDGYLSQVVEEMMPRVAGEKLAEYCDVFYERGYFNIDQSRRVLTAAKQHGLKLRMHVDQLTDCGGAKL